MLILKRTAGYAGDAVLRDAAGNLIGRVVLVEVTGDNTARIGFDFPQEISIARGEKDDKHLERGG